MNYFASDRLVLRSASARALYAACKDRPIFDYHNHLSPKLLYENENFENLSRFCLQGDHYIWRALRLAGVEERLITGDAPDEEKFLAWAGVLETLVGCPLYAWSQMQFATLFGMEEPLCAANAREVYRRCTALLQGEDFRPRNILKRLGVKSLCTTDEPFDSLSFHEKLQREEKELRILPAFRPDKLLQAGSKDWLPSLKKLEQSEGMGIQSLADLEAALRHSLRRFAALGCCTSDHGYQGLGYDDPTGAEEAFAAAYARGQATAAEERAIASHLLLALGRAYAGENMVMQLHVGALRNANSRRFEALGADCGVDSVDEPAGVRRIAPLLDALEREDRLPRTILYCLADSEYSSLMTLAASFAAAGVKNKVQVGSAWWFNDHERGMRLHLTGLMENGLLPGFVGMLTDSRSLGTFLRHDYFRRILCDTVGDYVERGEYPLSSAETLVNNICYDNAVAYFGG